MNSYWEIEGFSEVFLEDSWILNIRAEPGTVIVEMDIVLRESHEKYRAPASDEQYCYKPGRIEFSNVREVRWSQSGIRPAVDKTGESDYGSIDQFSNADGTYTLTGDFGKLEISSDIPSLIWN